MPASPKKSATKKIRIGIIGSGAMGRHRATELARRPGVKVTAISARNPETGPALARELGLKLIPTWEKLLERDDLDGVVNTTPNHLHGPILRRCLERDFPVLTEYPLTTSEKELAAIAKAAARRKAPILRTTHPGLADSSLRQRRKQFAADGPLLLAHFLRLTPGRGARPDVLFNLRLSGPPPLFFVYHLYPWVALFGGVEWVQAGMAFPGLNTGTTAYERFSASVAAPFKQGALAQWTWAGGIPLPGPEESERLVFEKATYHRHNGDWKRADRKANQTFRMSPAKRSPAPEDLFLADLAEPASSTWREDLAPALWATWIGLAAGKSHGGEGRVPSPSWLPDFNPAPPV